MAKPKLYIHFDQAKHFLSWELPYWKQYFTVVDVPAEDTILVVFGPDALESATKLPAKLRFAVLFPGFGYNPLYNLEVRKTQKQLIDTYFQAIFINPGPLELAYKNFKNVYFYPFSVDVELAKVKRYRSHISSLIHVSNNGPQKDWQRSAHIMKLTQLQYEVYPPRDEAVLSAHVRKNERNNKMRKIFRIPERQYLPLGYVKHELVIKKYQQYDGFVHVARDIKHPQFVDGKYTASLIEAGLTGAILFWHDTLNLGNSLKTVFDLPLDETAAAKEILAIRESLDVQRHSQKTREEMLDTFHPHISVGIRAKKILEYSR